MGIPVERPHSMFKPFKPCARSAQLRRAGPLERFTPARRSCRIAPALMVAELCSAVSLFSPSPLNRVKRSRGKKVGVFPDHSALPQERKRGAERSETK